jgi:hypothetical protein
MKKNKWENDFDIFMRGNGLVPIRLDKLKSFISTLLAQTEKEVKGRISQEITQYSGIDDIQTKALNKIIKNLK